MKRKCFGYFMIFIILFYLASWETFEAKSLGKPKKINKTPKVLVFSFERVAKKSWEVKKVEKWLKKMQGSLEKEIQKYKVEISNLNLEMKKVHPQSELYQKLKWKSKTKAMEMKSYVHFFTKKIQKEYHQRLSLALQKTRKKILEYCQKKKYAILLDQSNLKEGVFYVHPLYDITDELARFVQ
ncbi:MAG: hypothetical protein D6785_04290 [Planctomycetota bacterium]|nr:MAG: hypothetical protein D6785_04290 [Planctomycetota bacterium]